MAQSPTHRLGQIIGEVLEEAIEPLLKTFADKHDLYLDQKGPRSARKGNKLTWTDANGNKHDLDFVLERNGDDQKQGTPVAFIETAWRRYTKHSRNKAQEIQGAVLPLFETYQHANPFLGAIVAGVFTHGALAQLRSLGFTVLYFPYETVLKAFKPSGVDVRFDEETSDGEVIRKVVRWRALKPSFRKVVPKALLTPNKKEVCNFLEALDRSVMRQIKAVRILPLYGAAVEFISVKEALTFLEKQGEGPSNGELPFIRYEVQLIYTNDDRVEGKFADKENAIKFLVPFLQTSNAIRSN